MNWGKKLMIVFGLFAAMIITLVVLSMKQDFDMVTDNYYEEELRFQQQIDASNNAKPFSDQIQIEMNEDLLIIKMSDAALKDFEKGTIHFFRPSDESLDRIENLTPANVHQFERKLFAPGKYDIKFSWIAGGKKYYYQTSEFL